MNMSNANRRSFLLQSSVAAAAAMAIAPSVVARSPRVLPPEAPAVSPMASEPLAAYVRDASTGEVALLIGTREVLIRDLELVRRLVRAAG